MAKRLEVLQRTMQRGNNPCTMFALATFLGQLFWLLSALPLKRKPQVQLIGVVVGAALSLLLGILLGMAWLGDSGLLTAITTTKLGWWLASR